MGLFDISADRSNETDGFVARPPDRTLHDPCWRAARARTVEEKPRVYQWEERLGIEREQSLSKSSPDLSRLGLSTIPLPTLVRPATTKHVPLVSPSGRGEKTLAASLSHSTTNLSFHSFTPALDATGECLDKTFRQLKVATSWLKSLGSRPDAPETKGKPTGSQNLPNTS